MKSCYSKPSRGYVCQIFFSTTKLELLFKNRKLNIETRMSCMKTDLLVKVIKPSRGHNPQGHRLLRDIHDKRHLTSNTFNFRFHVRQEWLLEITLWQLLLSFFFLLCRKSFSLCKLWPRKQGLYEDFTSEEVLGSIFAGYVPLASQSPYPIIVCSVANYRVPIDPILVTYGPICNFRDPSLLVHYIE